VHDVQELARQHTGDAIDTLAEIMNDKKAPHSARLSAAEALLSRGWGRPAQPTVEAPGGGKTFEDWVDSLTGPGKEMLDRALRDFDGAPSIGDNPNFAGSM
jgi:hypothetical protein